MSSDNQEHEPLDRSYLANVTDGDVEFEEELAQSYIDASSEVMSNLRLAVQDADPHAVREAAHALKGSSRAIGADGMGAAAESLEHQGLDGDLSNVETLLDDAEQHYNALIEYMRSTWPTAK